MAKESVVQECDDNEEASNDINTKDLGRIVMRGR